MSGYWFDIVLVILSSLQLKTIAWSLLPKVPTPYYYPIDNACTRIKPAASVNQTIGAYHLCDITFIKYRICDMYTVSWNDDHFSSEITEMAKSDHILVSKFYIKRSYENPDVPGQMQNYPIYYLTRMINDRKIKPNTITVVAVYKKGIGYGLISCSAVNGSEVYESLVLLNMQKYEEFINRYLIIPIKNELDKIVNGTKSSTV
ncbi:hypothetical protein CHUAL_000172 [Chamberlinius hualienensis]